MTAAATGRCELIRLGTGAADSVRVSTVQDIPPSVPDFTQWPSFPFEGDLRVKQLDEPVPVEPPRRGEGNRECIACNAPDEAYIWVGERWRVRAMDRPTGLPMVLILESRSHLDLGDLPNLLAAELGVMTVRLERAIRSLDGVARVHVNRWGDGSAHLHMWFLARPYGQLQLRGTFLPLWDSILPPIPEARWRENLALVAAWLAEFGGRPLAEPPRIQWQAPSSLSETHAAAPEPAVEEEPTSVIEAAEEIPEPEETSDAAAAARRLAQPSTAEPSASESPQDAAKADRAQAG
jgi:diadenosine tetraphosphate (Ap4A) HIT family hydrolase